MAGQFGGLGGCPICPLGAYAPFLADRCSPRKESKMGVGAAELAIISTRGLAALKAHAPNRPCETKVQMSSRRRAYDLFGSYLRRQIAERQRPEKGVGQVMIWHLTSG